MAFEDNSFAVKSNSIKSLLFLYLCVIDLLRARLVSRS